MAIKWEDIIVSTTGITNQIILGKINKKGNMWTDKSADKTNEVLFAVTEHMSRRIEKDDNKTAYSIKFNGRQYHLQLTDLGEIKED